MMSCDDIKARSSALLGMKINVYNLGISLLFEGQCHQEWCSAWLDMIPTMLGCFRQIILSGILLE